MAKKYGGNHSKHINHQHSRTPGEKPNQAKGYVNNKLKEHQIRKIYSAAEEKSKVRDYICNKTRTATIKVNTET